MTREDIQQFTLRISQANPTEMVVILYEMLLCYLEEGKKAAEQQDKAAVREANRKARGCLNELLQSLHLEYEPAPALQQLYLFCIRRLALCEVKQEVQHYLEIENIIKPLRDAYQQLAKQNPSGPVMSNSQVVYAGLTYGKHTLTENMADQSTNRGMLA